MSLFDLYKGLSSLSPEQRTLFARRLTESGFAAPAGEIVPRPPGGEPVPASLTQQRLWLVDQVDPGDPFYNLPLIAFEIKGPLDVGALARTLQEIERRHEALRTTFAEIDGAPVQVIRPAGAPGGIQLPVLDLAALPEPERTETGRGFAFAFARRPFDLARGPLWRTHLLRWEGGVHLLCIEKHHIVSDAWSIAVFYREMSTLYAAFVLGRPSPLPELPIQYADFALWQRRRFSGERLADELAFWRGQLAGAPETIELPFDHPRPPTRTYRGRRQDPRLPAELPDALHALGTRVGASLFILLFAALDALLHRYSGQDELVLGSPVAGRNEVATEALIGFFVNTVVYRMNVSGDPTFRQLLSRVRDVALDVYEHQELPFDKLVEELQPKRNPAYGTIFQAMFSLQNVRTPDLSFSGLQVTQVALDNQTAQTDLIAFGGMREGRLSIIQIEYNTDLFEHTTIARLKDHLVNLLAAAAEDADRPLSQLPMLSEPERRQLLSWNAHLRTVYAGTGPELRLERLFAAQAARAPRAPAVIYENDRLTYGELDRRANQLAHRLRAQGVGPEARVGLCVERSADLVVAIVGILKAGGAYVPLHPENPPERQRFLMEDSAISVLVTAEALLPRLPPLDSAAHLVLLDADRAALDRESASPPETRGDAASLAYLIYTSGSTGSPKGTLTTHHNVVRMFPAMGGPFAFTPDEVWSLFHSYAFDFSVWELWGALLHGGTVVVVPQAAVRSPEVFLSVLEAERVTMLSQTPSAFRQLLGAIADAEQAPDLALRTILIGAEPLSPKTLTAWLERGLPGRLINVYGITETTIFVSYRPIDPDDVAGSCARIGGPIADLTLHVLDRYGEPLPQGVAGEICIGGAGLCRGYLNRPDLTAGRFVPDPFSGISGERLYRSGDLARRLQDGGVEYLGRIDNQVKIRGLRIELGEIEAALVRHPAVRAAAVLVREVAKDDTGLVAYLVAAERAAPDLAELRDFLKLTLPSYMVPAVFMPLAALPLNANGKVDRAALPAPERTETVRLHVAPRTPTEETLAAVWQELFALPRVSVHDDFFELGGHSLLATRLISRLRHRLGIELSARVVFLSPTLEAMAEEIDKAHTAAGAGPAALMPRLTRRARP